ncbi:MAG: ferritin [Ignavibacteriae bacterium HGW-Ignavibacteriae-3]|nr:MAG: ferritin [Ignavibacteriae bacterium HGW-Ignavibacteriae-3]
MISEKMQKALNDQINAELFSSYLYLSMAAYFESENWNGFAAWMKAQSSEEYAHAMKFYKYVNDVEGKVSLDAIEKPKASWKSPLQVFEEAHKHEIYITDRINKLVALAMQEKDYATNLFLNFFINEQIEEVSTVAQIVHKFNLLSDNKTSLFLLDRELGMRAQ